MKITSSDVIRSGEQELIDVIIADLDWGAIEDIFKKEHKLGIEEEVEYKQGDIAIHDNQIVYKLRFEVKISLSVLLDREGNYISVTSSGDPDRMEDENKEDMNKLLEESELPESGLEGKTDNDTEKPLTSDGVAEPEEGSEEALPELDSEDIPEDIDISQLVSPDEVPEEKISRIASQVGDMIEQTGD